ncbi:hypothetical protein GCM10009525_24180 [Streptosporangium amethystogenes subsp. fukuiense]
MRPDSARTRPDVSSYTFYSASWAKLAQRAGGERDPFLGARRVSLVLCRNGHETLRCGAGGERGDDGVRRVVGRPTDLFVFPQVQPWRRFPEFIDRPRESATIRRAFIAVVGQAPASERGRWVNLRHDAGTATVDRLTLPGKLGEQGRATQGPAADEKGGSSPR